MTTTWEIGGKTVKSLHIGEKEVKKLVRISDNVIIWEKPLVFTLTSNKNSLDISESAILTAKLTDAGVGVQGKTVRFCGIVADTATSRNITANTESVVGCKYSFPTIPTLAEGEKIYLDKDHKAYLYKQGNGTALTVKIGQGSTGTGALTSLSVENGIITYSTGGSPGTINCTDKDMSVIYSDINVTINDYGIFGTTDANGEVNVTYTPSSAGNFTITATCMDLSDSTTLEVNQWNLDLVTSASNLSSANNDTATLTATLTKNGTGVSGKKIIFSSPYGSTASSRTLPTNTWIPVGAKYRVTTLKTTLWVTPHVAISWDLVDEEYKITRSYSGTTTVDSGNLHDFYVENGVLYYTKGSTQKQYSPPPVSADFTKIKCSSAGCVIDDYGGFYYYELNTDSNGIATATYTAYTSGNLTISADYNNLQDTVQLTVT